MSAKKSREQVDREVAKHAASNGHPPGRQLRILHAHEVQPRPVRWLWEERVPLTAPTLLAGQPGLGKSQATCHLAAQVSRGTLPGDLKGEPRAVILLTAEDAIAETAVPRLMAAEADRTRIVFTGTVSEDGFIDTLDLQQDLAQLQSVIQKTKAALVVIDPRTPCAIDLGVRGLSPFTVHAQAEGARPPSARAPSKCG